MDKNIKVTNKCAYMGEILDSVDRRILFELDKNCRVPESALAKIVKKSREAVRYRIRKMEKEGIILCYTAFINFGKLGYQGYKLYLKTRSDHKRRREFREYLLGLKNLFWLGEADGAWDYGLTFFAKSNEEFYAQKNDIFSKFRDIILQKYTGAILEPICFGRKFLYADSSEKERKTTHLFGSVGFNKVDGLDSAILAELSKNARMHTVELAKMVGGTADVVRGRIKRLEKLGIICRYYAMLDYKKMGMEFYKSFLFFDSLPVQLEKKLYNFCKAHPNIVYLIRQISPWDVEIEIMVRNYAEYNAIINRIKEEFSENLGNVESAVMNEDDVYPFERTVF